MQNFKDKYMENITVAELKKIKEQKNITLIDVRTPAEYEDYHIPDAMLMPLDKIDPKILAENCPEQELYVVCQGGNRSSKACEQLKTQSNLKIINVLGGTKAWESAGYPLIRGKKTISLERQVRIAAGLLVIIGVLLGYGFSQNFILLSGFVGAGLVFAGITDTCGMAMLLAKMPWNQCSSSRPTCKR
jgi:rhodanese-related sulfurtransferase